MVTSREPTIYEFGNFCLDARAHRLTLRDTLETVSLAPRAVLLLLTLVCSKGRIVTKDELLDRVWVGSFVEEANLSQTIFVLRKALGDSPKHAQFIRTIPGRGYQFIAPVSESSGPVGLDLEQFPRFGSQPSVNTDAHKAYVQGRSFWNKRTQDGLKQAIVHFEEAISHDPSLIYAYSGLAESYRLLAEYYEAVLPNESKNGNDRTRDRTRHMAEAQTTLAYAQAFYEWDWTVAERSFTQAIELDPDYATAHQWYGDFLNVVGRFDAAREHFERAIELKPTSPIIATGLASYYYTQADADRLIKQAEKILALDADFAYGHFYLGFGYEFKGMEPEAVACFAAAATAFGEPEDIGEELISAYEWNGMNGVWHKRLEQYETRPHLGHYPNYLKSLVPIRLGDKETSIAWLQKAYKLRDRGVIYAKYEPLLKPLRDDVRFQELVGSIGLA